LGPASAAEDACTSFVAGDNDGKVPCGGRRPGLFGKSRLIGIWLVLVGLGKAKALRKADASARFVTRWGKFFLVSGGVLVVVGALFAASSLSNRPIRPSVAHRIGATAMD